MSDYKEFNFNKLNLGDKDKVDNKIDKLREHIGHGLLLSRIGVQIDDRAIFEAMVETMLDIWATHYNVNLLELVDNIKADIENVSRKKAERGDEE